VDFVVMDAAKAFVSGGPDKGAGVEPGLMLTGKDRVALDATGVAILREFGASSLTKKPVFALDQIRRAAELGVGACPHQPWSWCRSTNGAGKRREDPGHPQARVGERRRSDTSAAAGGSKAITLTPIVGTPRRHYAEMFIPGDPHFFGFLTGLHERHITELLTRRVSRGATCVDVGANIGYFSAIMACLAGPQGRVVAYEPVPENFEVLKVNVKIAGACGNNIVPVNAAVSDSD
jgi:hypothetical protein